MSERKPLTLEELRSIANKPYWHVGLRDDSGAPHWSILDPILAYHPEDYDYGKTWLAYAYEPTRIDRSAWEPCAKCRSCLSCSHVVESARDSRNACFWCDHMNQFKPMNFCPSCGRPLTDAAWEMLKNRLEINK